MTDLLARLSELDLTIEWVREQARDEAGNSWETEDGDPNWRGRMATSKLTPDRLQGLFGFVQAAVQSRATIDFVDPVYFIPAAYRTTGLPAGFEDGLASLVDASNGSSPVFAGLPVGLVLRYGDRISIRDAHNCRHHMVAVAELIVTDSDEQAVPVVPAVLGNVFEAGADVVLLNPPVRLNIVTNSWSAPRRAQSLTVASFSVEEASVVVP